MGLVPWIPWEFDFVILQQTVSLKETICAWELTEICLGEKSETDL